MSAALQFPGEPGLFDLSGGYNTVVYIASTSWRGISVGFLLAAVVAIFVPWGSLVFQVLLVLAFVVPSISQVLIKADFVAGAVAPASAG